MKFNDLKQQARNALANKWGLAILVTLLYAVFNYLVPNGIEWLLSGGDLGPSEPTMPQVVSGLISILLAPLTIGLTWYFMDLFDGERARWTHLFEPFDVSNYLKMLGSVLLLWLYSFLWTLLFIVPGLVKSLAYSQTFFVMKDHPEMSINEAITRSRQLMNGYKWRYFFFTLSFIGWFILALLTMGIGFLWLLPYYYMSCVAFYRFLVENAAQDLDNKIR
ncbi:MAG TPA: DUF975 family protein [Sporolactobacillaceae bacterium]|nr:DUF975 family protein [Sporolactobacillaceae bacterium]